MKQTTPFEAENMVCVCVCEKSEDPEEAVLKEITGWWLTQPIWKIGSFFQVGMKKYCLKFETT